MIMKMVRESLFGKHIRAYFLFIGWVSFKPKIEQRQHYLVQLFTKIERFIYQILFFNGLSEI